MHIVRLQDEVDFKGWRHAARRLLAAHIPPDMIDWQVGAAMPSLFADDPGVDMNLLALDTITRHANSRYAPDTSQFKVSAQCITLCQTVILHSDPCRFGLLYRLIWRMRREPRLLQMAFDADVVKLGKLAQAVRRDMHKMKAFVRFRETQAAGEPCFIAWFEPQHHILAALAPFFSGRFSNMRWSILTPRGCMHWHGAQLSFTAGARREDAPQLDAPLLDIVDAVSGEQLWCSYYRSIFNPARLKTKAMQAEMPKKYWRNLPEAGLIAELVAQADKRTQHMLEAEPQPVRRKVKRYVGVRDGVEEGKG